MRTLTLQSLLFALLLLASQAIAGDVAAFPGAEGFGAATPGGRGGKVLFVTTLADSGPGSLREAINFAGPRTIVFKTGGIIDLKSPLRVRQPYVTIAGQTAPGDGICLRYYALVIETHDVVVRFIRARLGDVAKTESDSFSIVSGARNVIVDHCSASWSVDESLSPSGDIADITVQWSLIAESLWHSVHSKGPHGYGSLVRATGGVSLHHNLWAHHDGRNPRLGANYTDARVPTLDVRNNVMYNWGSYCTGMVDGHIRVNYVGNYIRRGPNSSARNPIVLTENATEETRFYLAANFVDGRDDLTKDNRKLFDRTELKGKKLVSVVEQVFDAPAVSTSPAARAFDAVLAGAGATKPARDAVDQRVVASVRTRSGRLIDSQNDVGGWPGYNAGTAPQDSDQDGIPDAWEKAHRLDPSDPADGNKLAASGYTNLEVYLNELAGPYAQPQKQAAKSAR